jgi:hypothetical protein
VGIRARRRSRVDDETASLGTGRALGLLVDRSDERGGRGEGEERGKSESG